MHFPLQKSPVFAPLDLFQQTVIMQTIAFCSSLPSEGKNVRRSIHGMGQIMSTMVLNRKQSIFGGPGARGAGSGNALEGQRGSKDSIENIDLTVMDTKLKILEILQVTYITY